MSQYYGDRRVRSDVDYVIVRNAKRCLMRLGCVNEATAHHIISRAALARRVSMRAVAEWLLNDAASRGPEILASRSHSVGYTQPPHRLTGGNTRPKGTAQ